jgi:endonuclease I
LEGLQGNVQVAGGKMKALAVTRIALLIISITSFAGSPGNTTNQSFNKAKKILLNQVYFDHMTTFYCGCASPLIKI